MFRYNIGMTDDYTVYDECWETGEYTDQDCVCCPYKDECSGNDRGEDCDD